MSGVARRLGRLGRVWRTVRRVRPVQALAQLEHMVVGLRPPRPWTAAPPALAVAAPAAPFCGAPAHARLEPGRQLRLLNRALDVRGGVDWSFSGEGPLFAYHLHQHDYLRPGALAGDPARAPRARAEVMLDWVARHPRGVGWDPHPISVRSFAWTKLLTTPGLLELSPPERATLLASWASQLDCLDRNIEVRLQANHLLSNLSAVVLGGLVLEAARSPDWLARSSWLEDELKRQIRPDGAHEERSPMYHSLLLEQVLDLLNVARARGGCAPGSLLATLEGSAARMLGALDVWTHRDGRIALFSDSAFGIAPAPAELHAYAAALGIAPQPPARAGVLDGGGYVRLDAGPWTAIVSVAGPSPVHQPGHAHCDALSLELAHGPTRVVCDSGVYEYVPGERRAISRATRSHATLEVGGHEQAEVWSAHRVGGRPEVALVSAEAPGRCEASCVGWATERAKHTRRVEVRADGVSVRDRVASIGAVAVVAVWPLAPDLQVRLEGSHARVELPDGAVLEVELPGPLRWRVEDAPYYPEFGLERVRPVLVGEGQGPIDVLTRVRRIA